MRSCAARSSVAAAVVGEGRGDRRAVDDRRRRGGPARCPSRRRSACRTVPECGRWSPVAPASSAPTWSTACWPRATRSTWSTTCRPASLRTWPTPGPNPEHRLTFHNLDIRNPGLVDLMARRQPEVVFHLAAQATVPLSVEQPVLDAEINVIGSLHVLEGRAPGRHPQDRLRGQRRHALRRTR